MSDPRLNDHGYLWQLMSPDELADEIMELRAKLQVMTNERHMEHTLAQKYLADAEDARDEMMMVVAEKNLVEQDRDFWKLEADMWHKECTTRSGGQWFTANGSPKMTRWNHNEGRYEPDPDDH